MIAGDVFTVVPEHFDDYTVPDDWLSFAEIQERVTAAFAALGVSRLRLTGGEPFGAQGLAELETRLAALPGITDLSCS